MTHTGALKLFLRFLETRKKKKNHSLAFYFQDTPLWGGMLTVMGENFLTLFSPHFMMQIRWTGGGFSG
ncbi:MAG: hypothetical protein A3F89_06935 [Deltaproteobacteria bacterium RIFCSPLOWO2_12_FULL_50_11]|nr:MAG: hypothetical protein A3F89_06935 [Deltaproteobacteria bacterium RIFCSPLOWO2_12_FULL_50_11]